MCKLHVQLQALRIGLCHGERVRAGVHSHHRQIGPSGFKCQRNSAAAGAQVDHAGGWHRGQHFQRPLHQGFCIRAGHQHAGVDCQVQAKEFFVAGEVGQRLARRAAHDGGLQRGLCGGRHRVGVMRQQPGTVMRRAAHGLQHQQLGIESVQAQGRGVAQGLVQRHARPISSAASCSAASKACSAFTTSSRSPSMMLSSLYSVRLMRWSVRRPCGKL